MYASNCDCDGDSDGFTHCNNPACVDERESGNPPEGWDGHGPEETAALRLEERDALDGM